MIATIVPIPMGMAHLPHGFAQENDAPIPARGQF